MSNPQPTSEKSPAPPAGTMTPTRKKTGPKPKPKRRVIATLPLERRHRLLSERPLTKEDWRAVWLAYQGFLAQVTLIADEAERRAERQREEERTSR